MFIRNPETKEWEEVFLPPTGDTLPVGSIVDYDGDVVPTNYEKVEDTDIITNGNPVKCGYKIDGKDVYVKRIQSGNLGDNTSTTIPTNLTNVTIIEVTGNANNGSTYIGLAGYNDEVYYNTSNIMWNTKTNRTAFKAYLNVYFTYNEEV